MAAERIRRGVWALLVPVVAALAGVLFTTSARTSAGTSLRDDRRLELRRLIEERQAVTAALDEQAAALARAIDGTTRVRAETSGPIAAQQRRADEQRLAAGFTAVRGPGIRVVLDDAPRRADGALPAGARPDDVVVHQQDVQAVVNALWAGGAEAMLIMGVRVISTSAVRCVGNTLLLHGQVYSPPFEVIAIGDPAQLSAALAADPDLEAFRRAVTAYGLGYRAEEIPDVLAPAHEGSGTLEFATAA